MIYDSVDPLSRCLGEPAPVPSAWQPEPTCATAQHELSLLAGPEAILQTILRDVERARVRIAIETYIYSDGRLGRGLGALLMQAVARGVRTRLLYDPLGSQKTPRAFFDELGRAGIDVRAYRPLEVALDGGIWPRDHSRILVIDDVAYTGGAAWADEWLPRERGGGGWYDVCVRVAGPVVEDFARAFEQRWREASGNTAPVDLSTRGKYPDLEFVADAPGRRAEIYRRHRKAIERARKRVWMEHAYFFPPRSLERALCRAAARHVDTRIIVPAESDLGIMQRAARAEFGRWLGCGLRLYEYQPSMTHAKLTLIDDDWCTIGSFNANGTSVGLANEVSLLVHEPAFVCRVAEQLEVDLGASRVVTPAALAARTAGDKVLDRLAHGTLDLLDLMTGPAD